MTKDRGWFVVECAQRGYNDFSVVAQFVYEADGAEWMESQKTKYTGCKFRMYFEVLAQEVL